jgi:hypothetical protein
MKSISSYRIRTWCFCSALILGLTLAKAQTAPAGQTPAPVSYGSSEQLNQLLSRLDQASQSTQADIVKLRIDKWKTDSNTKRDAQGSVDSITRNLKDAVPGITAELRKSPEDLSSTFKLYRNLDALYDVVRSVTESAGAFGSKDDFQSLENDLESLEGVRRGLAERLEGLATSKQSELDSLRMQVQKAQAAATASSESPKKVVVDDTAPAPKKSVKKKPSSKTSPAGSGAAPATTATPTPPSQ